MIFSEKARKQCRRAVCLGLLGAMAPLALSCYGNFPLTKAVYRMNAHAGDGAGDKTGRKLVQSVVMWVLVIVPVYAVATFADAIVMNLIEFWSGEPVTISSAQTKDGVEVALKPGQNGNEALLTVKRDGKLLAEQHIVKTGEGRFEMRDARGAVTGRVFRTAAGEIQLADAQGRVMRTLPARAGAAL